MFPASMLKEAAAWSAVAECVKDEQPSAKVFIVGGGGTFHVFRATGNSCVPLPDV